MAMPKVDEKPCPRCGQLIRRVGIARRWPNHCVVCGVRVVTKKYKKITTKTLGTQEQRCKYCHVLSGSNDDRSIHERFCESERPQLKAVKETSSS
jgi:hypothetical protein